jgi:signal peptidase I
MHRSFGLLLRVLLLVALLLLPKTCSFSIAQRRHPPCSGRQPSAISTASSRIRSPTFPLRSTNEETPSTVVEPSGADNAFSRLASYNATLELPSFADWMALDMGEYVTSDVFTVTHTDGIEYDFLVKVYPRGGGHKAKSSILGTSGPKGKRDKSGFGMAYQQLPMFGGNQGPQNVGVYLQFVPRPNGPTTVDATFALRLVGRQSEGPRFNVEWRAGMRFVPLEETKLANGQANDFGAHLLQTCLLPDFLGVVEGDYSDPNFDCPIDLAVEVYLHRDAGIASDSAPSSSSAVTTTSTPKEQNSVISRGLELLQLDDLRSSEATARRGEALRVGHVVVPVLRRLSQRPDMFAAGTYPGVEYRILRMIDPETNDDVFYHRPGVDIELKPIYPLVSQLERPWPVRVNECDLPKLLSAGQYNAVSAAGSLLTAVTGLFTAWLLSQAISLFFIPSRSMEPTLQVGDVLLVEKVTPRLLGTGSVQPGQVVLFHPPSKLQAIVAQSGGRISPRDLFVKRVAATQPGDVLKVTPAGQVALNSEPTTGQRDLCTAEPLRLIESYIKVGETTLQADEVAVLGDCASVSVDSRVWGPLPRSEIVGKPLVRIWPLERFGKIGDLPTSDTNLWKDK